MLKAPTLLLLVTGTRRIGGAKRQHARQVDRLALQRAVALEGCNANDGIVPPSEKAEEPGPSISALCAQRHEIRFGLHHDLSGRQVVVKVDNGGVDPPDLPIRYDYSFVDLASDMIDIPVHPCAAGRIQADVLRRLDGCASCLGARGHDGEVCLQRLELDQTGGHHLEEAVRPEPVFGVGAYDLKRQ